MSKHRQTLLDGARRLVELRLNTGAAGNISVRDGEGFLITPSGLAPDRMALGDMVQLGFDGQRQGLREPSSEWRLHRDILQSRPEIGAVVHTHSMFAGTFACLRQEIPPIHYMIAVTGASHIRCAPYALFGTQQFSDAAVVALLGSKACLLANHGMVALGRDLGEALAITLEVETLCERYWRALQVGTPVQLSEPQMEAVFERFKDYGQWRGHGV